MNMPNKPTTDSGDTPPTSTPTTQSRKARNTFKKFPTKPSRFKGRCNALENHVYDRIGTKQQQAENYAKTTEEIANYVGKE